jgi:hypothetical protein
MGGGIFRPPFEVKRWRQQMQARREAQARQSAASRQGAAAKKK